MICEVTILRQNLLVTLHLVELRRLNAIEKVNILVLQLIAIWKLPRRAFFSYMRQNLLLLLVDLLTIFVGLVRLNWDSYILVILVILVGIILFRPLNIIG